MCETFFFVHRKRKSHKSFKLLTQKYFSPFAVQYFENSRGVPRLHIDGFFYRLNTRSSTSLHWSCELRASLKCRAALTTNPASPFDVKILTAEHNHDRTSYKNLAKLRAIKDKRRIVGNLFVVKQWNVHKLIKLWNILRPEWVLRRENFQFLQHY